MSLEADDVKWIKMFDMIYILSILILFFIILLLRAIYLIYKIRNNSNKYAKEKCEHSVKTVICIGSGGHTTEMIKVLEKINPKNYNPRYYIMANTDIVSEEKITYLEKDLYHDFYKCNIVKIPRSRKVNQSYVTSVFTTLYSIVYCIPVLFQVKPDLILCNGPGTCVPICLIAFLMKMLFLSNTRIIFIESICRVKTLSLTGKILNYFAENIVIQWKELKSVCPRADYLGQLF